MYIIPKVLIAAYLIGFAVCVVISWNNLSEHTKDDDNSRH